MRGLVGLRGMACAAGVALFTLMHGVAVAEEPLQLEKFSERLSKDVPVSGRLLVGAVVVDAARVAPNLAPRLLWRTAPNEPTGEPLCVTLASRDGLYYGEGEIPADKLASQRGPVRVQGGHKPEIAGHLRALAPDELAMLASRGDCRLGLADVKALTTVHVLDRREISAGGPFTLRLMLNSLTYTLALEAAENGGAARALACTTLEGAQRNKAFNTVCDLPLSAASGTADLVIQRRRFERGFPELKMRLVWGAP